MRQAEELFGVAGKTALVTGGSRGIGLMIAEGLVRAGVRVYISSRKAEVCAKVAAELSEIGECISVPEDLSTDAGARRLAHTVGERESALNILVNNAGATWGAPLEDYPESAFDKLWATNVKAPFRLTTELLPALRAAATTDDPARVVNIGSVGATNVSPSGNAFAYGQTKAALHHMTRQLAHQLNTDPITVNALAPGPFESKMMAYVLDVPARRHEVEEGIPLGRIGRPADIVGDDLPLLTGGRLPAGRHPAHRRRAVQRDRTLRIVGLIGRVGLTS